MTAYQNKHVHDIEHHAACAQASVDILIFLSEGTNEPDRNTLRLQTITLLHSVAERLTHIDSAITEMAKPDLRTVS